MALSRLDSLYMGQHLQNSYHDPAGDRREEGGQQAPLGEKAAGAQVR